VEILIINSAFSDLGAIKDYYSEQGVPHVAHDIISSIFEHIQSLTDHPSIGRLVPEFDDETIREIIHPPYRIVYLLDVKVIQIIRIWRSERLLKLPKKEV